MFLNEDIVIHRPQTRKKEILLIIEKHSFTTSALVHGLEKAGYKIMEVNAKLEDLSMLGATPDIWVLIADNYIQRRKDLCVYIKDLIVDKNKSLFVIGDPAEIELLASYFPANVPYKAYTKPFNAQDLIEDIDTKSFALSKQDNKKKILIVDDNPVTLKGIKTALETKYRVFIVTSGADIFSFLANNTPDLILLDYDMPYLDGLQIMKVLSGDNRYSSIPVMFLTSKNDTETIVNAFELKAKNYLLKNMGQQEIIGKIDGFFLPA